MQPVKRYDWGWVACFRGVGGMEAAAKPTGRYLRRPLKQAAQPQYTEVRMTGYTREERTATMATALAS